MPVVCIQCLRQKLYLSEERAGVRAIAVFDCGFWAQLATLTCTGFVDNFTKRELQAYQWVLFRGEGVSKPFRAFAKEDLLRLVHSSPEKAIIVPVASEAELLVLCCGADIAIPPLVAWTRHQ